jgi:hypothetical protein
MFNVASFAIKYPKHSPKYNSPSLYNKIKATIKWVEYSLDVTEMTKMITKVSREEKYVLLAAMEIAERKRDYMYKHPNFELQKAMFEFKRAKRLLKI